MLPTFFYKTRTFVIIKRKKRVGWAKFKKSSFFTTLRVVYDTSTTNHHVDSRHGPHAHVCRVESRLCPGNHSCEGRDASVEDGGVTGSAQQQGRGTIVHSATIAGCHTPVSSLVSREPRD